MAQSSNIGTILAGEKVSPERIHRYLRGFGFGERTGVGLPEASGELAPPGEWSSSQRYTVLFGQGVSMTTLQAAGVFATLANDGVRLRPRLIAGVTGRTACSGRPRRPRGPRWSVPGPPASYG